LLLVGGDDSIVVGLNEDALRQLKVTASLEIVPGAGHLFEEPGALETVAAAATRWLVQHLVQPVGRLP
jgi:putative phosphoribosyl transferase